MKMYICVDMKDVCWKYFKEKKNGFSESERDTIVAYIPLAYIILHWPNNRFTSINTDFIFICSLL